MVVFPNAKINLGLDILRRRDDGYHDIDTVMVGVDWCDILEVVPAAGDTDTLTVSGRHVDCPPEKNLVIKALKAVRRSVDVPPVDIYLHKIIPDGAGLGGGSADAAFMILALNELYGLGLSREQMADIAAEVGSDCPFFIYNRPMLATGRGEILTPVNGVANTLAKYRVVIVKPEGCAVSTAQAYAGVSPHPRDITPDTTLCNCPVAEWRHKLANDFETTIFAVTDRPRAIKERLYALGADYAAMSGSGSAVFGLFADDVADGIDFGRIFPDDALHIGHTL